MRIAIVRLSAMGDIIQSMIVLQFIKCYYPNAQIDWFVDSSFAQILEHNPDIFQIHEVDFKDIKRTKSFLKLLKILKKIRELKEYDYVFDLQGLLKSAIITKVINSKHKIGFDKNSLREPIASFFYNRKYTFDYGENVVLRNLFLIEQTLNIKHFSLENKKPFLFFKKNSPKVKISNYAVIVIGASFSAKIYPLENFKKVIDFLECKCILVWGNKQEKLLAQTLERKSPKALMAPKLSLNELKQLIANSNIVLGGDTGPTHMAWALNIPSITLFGPTPHWRNAYKTKINSTLSSGSLIDIYNINKKDGSIKDINPQDIADLANAILMEKEK